MNITRACLLACLVLIAPALAAGQIPPGASEAPEALKSSPRHGEWVDVALPGSDVKIKSWVVYPERKDKAPVVIVIHEIFGLTDWVRGVADQLAADGFIAIAPDLLSGMGPNGGGTDSLGDKVREVIRTLSPADVNKRLDAVRDYALSLPSASGKSGCVGFCWGGSSSFAYAVHQSKLNGAVVYYGTAPKEASSLGTVACPVLGLYGQDDARVNATIDPTKQAMKEHGKSYDVHIFDGAGHGFLRQQDGRDGANLKASQEAWKLTLEFFRKNLE